MNDAQHANHTDRSAADTPATRRTRRKDRRATRESPLHSMATLRAIALALASAALLALASPPLDVWPLAWVALIPLYLAIREAPARRAALLAWLMGSAANLAGSLWWAPLLERFAGLDRPAGLAVGGAIAIYQGATFALWAGASALLARRMRLSWLFVAPLCLVIAETLLPYLFKWYLAISIWRVWPAIQLAELGGPAAVSALLLLSNLALAEAGLALVARRRPPRAALIGALTVALLLAAGMGRAAQIAAARQSAPHMRVGLVQPNFGITSLEDRKLHGEQYIRNLRDAADALTARGAELIVWPESAWPYLFDRASQREYPPGHPWEMRTGARGRLLFGALTHDFGQSYVQNSAVLVTKTGEIAGRYDKTRLVPFGEYIPLAETFPDWAKSIRENTPEWPEVRPGTASQLLVDGDLRIALLICSEELDQALALELARQQPNLLVAITNDAWFGDSGAARQHMAMAAFRAVELRRDMARDTNTGVSAIVDALGRVQAEGPLFDVPPGQPAAPTLLLEEVALLDQPALAPMTVPFFPYACVLALVLGALMRWRSDRRASLA